MTSPAISFDPSSRASSWSLHNHSPSALSLSRLSLVYSSLYLNEGPRSRRGMQSGDPGPNPQLQGPHQVRASSQEHDNAESPPASATASVSGRPSVLRLWAWEILLLVAAVGLIITIAVILAHFDGQEVPE